MSTVRIAFLVLGHQDPLQLKRLCRSLQPHSVFLHLDAKAKDFSPEAFLGIPNISLVEPRTAVHWGDFSSVTATLKLLQSAHDSGPFDRYVLLSGACYPVKPMAALEMNFASDETREWINLTEITRESHLYTLISRHWQMEPFVRLKRLDAQLRAAWNKVSRFFGRNFKEELGMTPYFGSQWWALTRDCVGMILRFIAERPSFIESYQTIYAPDEQFFHTIVGNSLFTHVARHVDDLGSATNQQTPLHLVSPTEDRIWHAESGQFQMLESTDAFFIRKVTSEQSGGGFIERIDRELLNFRSTE